MKIMSVSSAPPDYAFPSPPRERCAAKYGIWPQINADKRGTKKIFSSAFICVYLRPLIVLQAEDLTADERR
jgi:hypothetical protein